MKLAGDDDGVWLFVTADQLLAEPQELEQVAVPLKVHSTYEIGTGIEPVLLDCHIRYIVASKDLVSVVQVEAKFWIGASVVGKVVV